jgi:uncharacterized protein YjfI (DUF2170 family)
MNHLTTETVAKSLASALVKDSAGENLFASVKVTQTENGDVILVQQESEGNTVFITVDQDEVRTVSYLWEIDTIAESQRELVLLTLLQESMQLPLVSFGADRNEITLFGSMSTSSGENELIEEVTALFSATDIVVSKIDSGTE